MKRIAAFFLLMCVGIAPLYSQGTKDFVFQGGEYLRFTVSYRAKLWPNTDMAGVTMRVTNDTVDGVQALKVEAYATISAFRWFFKLDDYYYTWFDKSTGLPIKAKSELKENDYRYSTKYIYDWSENISTNHTRNHKYPDPDITKVSIEGYAMDALSLFYLLRNEDFSTFTPGETRPLKILMDKEVKDIRYKYFGPENKNIPNVGVIPTLKFSCQLVTSDGEVYQDGMEFFLWVTDDYNKIPVFIDSPIRVGSIQARLVEWRGLKESR